MKIGGICGFVIGRKGGEWRSGFVGGFSFLNGEGGGER